MLLHSEGDKRYNFDFFMLAVHVWKQKDLFSVRNVVARFLQPHFVDVLSIKVHHNGPNNQDLQIVIFFFLAPLRQDIRVHITIFLFSHDWLQINALLSTRDVLFCPLLHSAGLSSQIMWHLTGFIITSKRASMNNIKGGIRVLSFWRHLETILEKGMTQLSIHACVSFHQSPNISVHVRFSFGVY